LLALRQRGVWLVDASVNAMYSPGGHETMSPELKYTLHKIWWEHYGQELLEHLRPAYRCVIGSGVAKALTTLGVDYDNFIYQPQARGVMDRERGWDDLLGVVGSIRTDAGGSCGTTPLTSPASSRPGRQDSLALILWNTVISLFS